MCFWEMTTLVGGSRHKNIGQLAGFGGAKLVIRTGGIKKEITGKVFSLIPVTRFSVPFSGVLFDIDGLTFGIYCCSWITRYN